jgi:AcrR family transcriptional regulator
LRRRIVEAGHSHFNAHRLERASVDAIAADAGVSKMTIYCHFASKEGLFEAVIRDRTDRVMGGLPGVEALDPTQPLKALLTAGDQFLMMAREENVQKRGVAVTDAMNGQDLVGNLLLFEQVLDHMERVLDLRADAGLERSARSRS